MSDDAQAADVKPPKQDYYPVFVGDSDEARLRWDLCMSIACQVQDVPPGSADQRMAAKVLFDRTDIPTT